jgi:dipeptidyl aminopeptidase/acylaminoacyl peptidase
MFRRTSLAVVAGAAVALASAHAQARRPITEIDLFKFTWVADPQISPDGAAVAFVRVNVNEKENRYETAIFAVSADASAATPPRRLTAGTRDASPRWSPDGRRLAFVRAVEKDGKLQPGQIYLLSLDGGEARPLTDLPKGASQPVWSPDGRTIAFISTTTADDLKRPDAPETDRQPAGHRSDVKIITHAVYRANGNPGWLDADRHGHIWTVGAPAVVAEVPKPAPVTTGDFDERDVEWAPDSSTIYFVSNRTSEPYYAPQDSDLYSVPAGGGAIAKVASIDGTIGDIAVSPDGKRIAFVGTLHGNPVRSYSQPDLWVTDAAPAGTPRNLTVDYDFDIAGGIGGDQAAPRGDHPKPVLWTKDGGSLIVVSAEHGSANLERVSVETGAVEPLTSGNHAVMAYTGTPGASTIAAIISTQTSIGDIFSLTGPSDAPAPRRDAGRLEPRRITGVNDDLFGNIAQSQPEEIWYPSFDGRRIQGWILKPPDFDPAKKYPMILEIHGGPHSAYGNTYTHEFQWMAAKGYVVLFVNPRGSTSYGQEFGNIIQFHYPGDDYRDLMAGVDEIVTRGYVDPDRLGVTGGSGGGLLTDWTITQTQRFKAAVAQRDIADWYGFWFTADFTLFQPTWFHKAPWEDPDDFHQRSPITHVASVTTPLMLVLGDADFRTPPADGGEMMFRALKYRHIPTVMVRFPRENHELSRSGEPWHRVERLQHIVGWMDQWLMGRTNPAYATR